MTEQEKNTNSNAPAPQDLQALLGDGLGRRWWQSITLWLGLLAVAAAAGGWWYWQAGKRAQAVPRYVTQEVQRGQVRLTVAANGTLQPTRSVNIGSELSGTVRRVLVDVNDVVKKGQVLVELDTTKLDAQVLRSRAAVASAQARLAQAAATVKEARASLARLEEVARLSGGKVPSAAELDAGRASYDRAQADEAAARASVQDARAALATDETNVTKASIRSPIDGVVLSRVVEPGNAVAASLQAVTLLTLAEDLSRLRLEVSVDEADVGAVRPGQQASFTVSAYPSRPYPARTTRVAFGSTKTDNVVTYITYLEVDNADLSLRPGMTAAATITSTQRDDVLTVPNTALRFTPAGAAGDAAAQGPAASGDKAGGGIMGQLIPRMPRQAGQRRSAGDGGKGGAGQRQIWVLEGGAPRAMRVKVGISDGRVTEVEGDALQPGMQVITDQLAAGTRP
ncbi:efflux RND transporter periplasmic adaptor subunit [Alicycliphilus denitrificans]|uniref:efflux RND transporter periplasmic adaptor subunit n=1 Tax=Alicycliphilus denitrificans TaxID=179636 RepID=UPI00384C6743